MAMVTAGIDLAKAVFAVHGVDETVMAFKPAALPELIAKLPPAQHGYA